MKRKITSAALLIALLASLASCGGSTSTDTTAADTTSSAPEVQEDVYSLGKYLPEQDLGGFQYTILAFYDVAIRSLFMEEENGSIVDDAVAAKIRTVEEHLNCDIVLSEMCKPENTEGNTEISTSVLSGEYEFDLAMAHDISMANLSMEGMFVNVMDLKAFNFDAEWWPQKTIDSMRVGNKMYLMSNNVSYYPVSDLRVMFFNKKLMDEYQFGSPYELVYDGKWTFDKMNEMSSSVYKDLNGNTKRDEFDQYGIVNMPHYYGWLEALNVGFYTADKNGTISYNFDMDRNTKVVDALYSLLFDSEGGYITEDDGAIYIKMFDEGLSLFTYTRMNDAVKVFSQSDVQYGILPMPKLDENQKEYFGGCTDKPTVIPITVPAENLEKVATVTEALNIEGYYSVFPVYYETALKTRYSDETDDAKMIDIVHNNRILSFSYLYGGFEGPALRLLETLFDTSNPSKDVASYAASIKAAQDERVKKMNEAFAD